MEKWRRVLIITGIPVAIFNLSAAAYFGGITAVNAVCGTYVAMRVWALWREYKLAGERKE